MRTHSERHWQTIAARLTLQDWTLGWCEYESIKLRGWLVDAKRTGIHHRVITEDLNSAFLTLAASIQSHEMLPNMF